MILWGSIKGFDETSHVTIGLERAVRDMSLDFIQQVHEWKNVLLLGKDPAAHDKHWAAFTAREAG